MAKSQDCSFLPHRILTRGCAFAFFVTAILSASVFSFAAIVGTENFEENGKTGWNWDGGTAQEWTVSSGTFTREDDGTGNMRAKVNGQAFLGFGTSNQLTSGTFVYTFDMEIGTTQNQWGGLSLYNGTKEITFFGNLATTTPQGEQLTSRYCSPLQDASTSSSYLNTNKTYAVVGNSSGIFAWAYDLGTKPKYEDLYTTPTLQLTSTLSGNNRFRLGTNGTMYFDNIKMAYSDSSTVASKGDATSMSSLTDIFGAVPIVECIKESFSNYETGALAGQFQQNLGQAPITKWTGSTGPTIDNSKNLNYQGWSSEQGVLNVSGAGNGAVMTLDANVMDDWGLVGTDGLIGGAGISDKILYYGFLMQQVGNSGKWNMGAELYRNGRELLGMSYHDWTSPDNMAGVFYDSSNTERRLNFTNDQNDNDTHLFVVKLMFGADGTGDDALIFIDPDMALSEEDQDPDHVYKLSDLTHLSSQDLSFDNIVFRGERAFTIDELRLAQTWWALSDYNDPSVPEPSTWALLLLGAAGLLYVRKRK